jgi:nitroreductase
VPDAAVRRILEAGRIAGSSRNRRPWRFLVVADPGVRERLAEAVYAPGNVRGAALVVAVAVRGSGPTAFDAGRAAQNMMPAAWNDEGIGSCPNGMPDPDGVGRVLGLGRTSAP